MFKENLKTVSFVVLIFLVSCGSKKSNNQLLNCTKIDTFKKYYDTIPNIILPFHLYCPQDSGIPTDRIIMSNYIDYEQSEDNFIPKYSVVIGKILMKNYVLIAYFGLTSGESTSLRTFTKNGQVVDEMRLFHA